MTLNFIRCDHATIVLIIVLPIFENVFYLEKKRFIMCYFHLKLHYLHELSDLQIPA